MLRVQFRREQRQQTSFGYGISSRTQKSLGFEIAF
jgi:hypothetical protein